MIADVWRARILDEPVVRVLLSPYECRQIAYLLEQVGATGDAQKLHEAAARIDGGVLQPTAALRQALRMREAWIEAPPFTSHCSRTGCLMPSGHEPPCELAVKEPSR